MKTCDVIASRLEKSPEIDSIQPFCRLYICFGGIVLHIYCHEVFV